ncbi:hypothetical protein BLOT_013573 [Blomia tropicalis]|nr:hypothetical protein BLOT_013573 [Blomia tropicalis]
MEDVLDLSIDRINFYPTNAYKSAMIIDQLVNEQSLRCEHYDQRMLNLEFMVALFVYLQH